jgi:hypothetical protein
MRLDLKYFTRKPCQWTDVQAKFSGQQTDLATNIWPHAGVTAVTPFLLQNHIRILIKVYVILLHLNIVADVLNERTDIGIHMMSHSISEISH